MIKIVKLSLLWGATFAAAAFDQGNGSPPSAGAPYLLSRTSTTLEFGWHPPATDYGHPITGYRIQRREAMGTWRGICRAVTGNQCEVTNLSPGSSQALRVRASNSSGRGDWSEEVTFNTLPRDGNGQEQLCLTDDYTVCLHQNRFEISLQWAVPDADGRGNVRLDSDSSGEFHVGPLGRQEILRIELYDNCKVSGFYSIRLLGILDSQIPWSLRVTDTHTGKVKEYFSWPAKMNTIHFDQDAFATCDA